MNFSSPAHSWLFLMRHAQEMYERRMEKDAPVNDNFARLHEYHKDVPLPERHRKVAVSAAVMYLVAHSNLHGGLAWTLAHIVLRVSFVFSRHCFVFSSSLTIICRSHICNVFVKKCSRHALSTVTVSHRKLTFSRNRCRSQSS